MLSRDEVIALYQLILDRNPESEQIVNEKRKAPSVQALAIEMMHAEEFMARNRELLQRSPRTCVLAPELPLRHRMLRRLAAFVLRTSIGKAFKDAAKSVMAAQRQHHGR